jgi:hypothetical protein
MERIILYSLCSFILGINLLGFAYRCKLTQDISIVVTTISYELLLFSAIYFVYNVISCVVSACKERMSRKLIWDTTNGVIFDPETKEKMFDFRFYGVIGIFFDSKTKDLLCVYHGNLGKYFDKFGNVITMNKLDKEWQLRNRTIAEIVQEL